MPSARALFAALLLAACGSSPLAASTVASLDLTPPPADAGIDFDAAPPLPPDVTDATTFDAPATACSSKQSAWRGALALRVEDHGAPYAGVTTAHAIDLSIVDDTRAFVTVDTGRAHARGFVDTTTLVLSTRTAVAFGGFFVPRPVDARLDLTRVEGDHATLTPRMPGEITFLGTPPDMSTSVACSDLGIDHTGASPDTLWAGTTPLRTARFPAKRSIPFATSESSAAIATYATGEDPETVSVFEEHTGHAHVTWHVSSGSVTAWVSSRDLRPPPRKSVQQRALETALADMGQQGVLSVLGGVPTSSTPALTNPIACTGTPRILAVRDGHRVVVGSIDPQAPFSAGAIDGLTAPLTGVGSLLAAPGTTLVLPARDLVACSPSTAPEAVDERPLYDGSVFGEGALGDPPPPTPPPALGLGSGPSVARIRAGTPSINGHLAPEAVRRVVRANYARMRLCYEQGLRWKPALKGRVAIKFVVDRAGAVSLAADGGSDLPDRAVVACIAHTFTTLVFPKPDSGIATVVYPFVFSYGD